MRGEKDTESSFAPLLSLFDFSADLPRSELDRIMADVLLATGDQRWNALVRNARFNQVVDPTMFTLAGLDIPAGTRAIKPPQGFANQYWDGTKLVGPGAKPKAQMEPSRVISWRWLFIAINLAIIAAILLFTYRRRRPAT